MTTIGGRAALGAAAIVLAACGGHTATPATGSPAASLPASHPSNSAATAAGAVHFPAQLLGLNENTSAVAKQAASILDRQFASRTADVVGGKSAIYGGGQNGATPFFFVVAGPWARRVASPDHAAHVLQNWLVTRGFTDARLLPAGPNGEALVCGHKHVQTGTDTVCEWADQVTFGAVLYPPGFASNLSDGASKTSQIRSAVVG